MHPQFDDMSGRGSPGLGMVVRTWTSVRRARAARSGSAPTSPAHSSACANQDTGTRTAVILC